MPETVSANVIAGFIEVQSTGIVTLADVKASVAEIGALMNQHGFVRILSDTRGQTEVPSLGEIYEFGESLPRGLKIALLVNKGQPTTRYIDFLQLVAQNRGVMLELFATREEAETWLK